MNYTALAENLGLQEDEYAELVALFIETSRPQITELRAAAKDRDREGIRKIAHSLKGASGNLGLMEISLQAKKIEEQSGSGFFDAVGDSIEEMENLIEALFAEHF